MSARATSSDQRSPCDKPAASWILSGAIWRGSSFLKAPRNLGVGTKTVMPRRSASARSGRCGESGLTLLAVALFHGSISRSRAATSAPAKFGIRRPYPRGPRGRLDLRGLFRLDGSGLDYELYNVKSDPGQLNNLLYQRPAPVAIKKEWMRLHQLLTTRLVEVANLPDSFSWPIEAIGV
jgi:hypothetical protein